MPRAGANYGVAIQVGAGTMNPATFLRVIGPEEWKTCYIEPSVRPDDSRYGENPNRLQQHTQLQVTYCRSVANLGAITTPNTLLRMSSLA